MRPNRKLTPEEIKIKKRKIMTTLAKITIIMSMIIASYIIFQNDIRMHEKVHKLIFEDYGINGTIKIKGMEGVTIGAIPNNMSKEDYRFMTLAHEMNEIQSYNNDTTKILLIILIFVTVAISLRNSEF